MARYGVTREKYSHLFGVEFEYALDYSFAADLSMNAQIFSKKFGEVDAPQRQQLVWSFDSQMGPQPNKSVDCYFFLTSGCHQRAACSFRHVQLLNSSFLI